MADLIKFKYSGLEKLAYERLPRDPRVWDVKIKELLLHEHPELTNARVAISFDKANTASGYALGKIAVAPQGREEAVYLPFIIENFRIYPFDLMIKQGELLPYDPEWATSFFTSADIYSIGPSNASLRIDEQKTSSQLPLQATYLNQIYGKFASEDNWLAAIAPFTGEQTKKKLAAKLEEYPELKKIAGVKKFLETPQQDIWVPLGGWSNGEKCYLLINDYRKGALEVIEKTASKKGYWSLFGKCSTTKVNKLASATDPGFYLFTLETGEQCGGYYIPKVTDFEKVYDSGVVIFPTGLYSRVDKVASLPVDGNLEDYAAFPQGKGIFIFEKQAEVLATNPVEVSWIGDEAFLSDSKGNTYRMHLVKELESPAKVAEEVFIPEKAAFIPVKDEIHVDHPKTSHRKVIIKEGDGGYYILDPYLDNLYEKPLKYQELLAVLASYGLPKKEAAELCINLKKEGQGEFYTALAFEPLKLEFDKLASETPLEDILFDSAATLSMIPGVDKVLSLALITPENLMVFVSKKDQLHDVLRYLASLLFLTRLGLRDINEASLRAAIKSIVKIKKKLDKLMENLKRSE